MRLERALCAVVLVGLVGGCTSSSSSSSSPGGPTFNDPASAPSTVASAKAWSEPPSYSYVLTRGCDTAAPLGRYQAKVVGGVLTAAERAGGPAVDPSASAAVDLGPVTGQEGEEIEVPTLAELVAMAATATEDGAEVSTAYDATDGHLVKVTINVTDTEAGAECWSVADYNADA